MVTVKRRLAAAKFQAGKWASVSEQAPAQVFARIV